MTIYSHKNNNMATKVKNFTIPEEILEKLAFYSKENLVPQSALITKLLKEFFEKNNKNE
jgi:hypothetical protein